MGSRTDIGDGGSNSDFDTRISLLREFALEELVQLGVEDTIGNELALFGNCSLRGGHDCSVYVCGLICRRMCGVEAGCSLFDLEGNFLNVSIILTGAVVWWTVAGT